MSLAPAVLKFGGSTFQSPSAYGELAEELTARLDTQGRPLAVVVSAMPGETEALRERLLTVAPHPADECASALLTLADTVSAHLLTAALRHLGRRATVLAGHQTGFTTAESFMWARLDRIDPAPLRAAFAEHDLVVVPGGQAVDDLGRPTWLGKNSSDLSAVAAAVALGADTCEIHSDVAGIHSCDPNLITGTRLLEHVSYDDATMMSGHGAKVLHDRSVRLAREHGVKIVCRRNTAPFPSGTVIEADAAPTDAVILNSRSVVLRYPDQPSAERAHTAFRLDGGRAAHRGQPGCRGDRRIRGPRGVRTATRAGARTPRGHPGDRTRRRPHHGARRGRRGRSRAPGPGTARPPPRPADLDGLTTPSPGGSDEQPRT